MEIQDRQAAKRLAAQIELRRAAICQRVAESMLETYPEIIGMLRMTTPSPAARLSAVSVERFAQLLRAVLLFGQPTLADKELGWAAGVLPRHGVASLHQAAMIRLFFAELRAAQLSQGEVALALDLEHYLLDALVAHYPAD